jgi:hypothetical protein
MSDELPTAQKIFEAFDELPLDPVKELPLIRTLHKHPDSTAADLCRHLGYETDRSWNAKFGAICKRRVHNLGSGPISKSNRNKYFVGGNIVDYNGTTKRLKLRIEAIDAFRRLGVI